MKHKNPICAIYLISISIFLLHVSLSKPREISLPVGYKTSQEGRLGIVGLSRAMTSMQERVRSVAEFVLVLPSIYLRVLVVHDRQNYRENMSTYS